MFNFEKISFKLKYDEMKRISIYLTMATINKIKELTVEKLRNNCIHDRGLYDTNRCVNPINFQFVH